MPKFRLDTIGTMEQEHKGWQETIVDRLGQGKVLPFVGNSLCNTLVFGSHSELIEAWATFVNYPFKEGRYLTRIAQYKSIMSRADPTLKADDVFIKEVYLRDFLRRVLFSFADSALLEKLQEEADLARLGFSDIAERLNCLELDKGQDNPLLLLADLPLKIYLTTSYHRYLEFALTRAGKKPRTEICYWNNRLRSVPSLFGQGSTYEPSVEEPLVYHLHGVDTEPASLVLTEDDHLDFLVAVSRDWNTGAIPLRVRQALTESSLMMLGYTLRDWDFRVLFRGIIKPSLSEQRSKSVAIQVADDENEKAYLQNYLAKEADFEVFWGEAREFVQDLWAAYNT